MQVQDAEKWKFEDYASVVRLLKDKKSYLVESGTELLSPEPSVGYMLYLKTGLARVLYHDTQGMEILMGHIHAGEICGEMGLFQNGQQASNVSVRAVSRCSIYRISYVQFRREAWRNPHLVGLLMRQLSQRMKRTTKRLTDVSLLSVKQRIGNVLIELALSPVSKTHPQGRQIRISRQDLALMVGCSRESAGRAIQQLDREHFLRAKGQTMLIYGGILHQG